MQEEIRICKKHGSTEFRYYKSGDRSRWRCLKC